MLDYKVVSIVEDKLGEVQDQRERDAMIKYLIQEADFEIAYYLVCTYITKRNVMDLHKSIISNISNNKSTLDLAPRGFGKSTVGDVDYCITRILRDPNIRIMIGSKTQTQAEAFLKEVRTHFEQNEDLIRIFGDWKTSKDNVWNDREFTVNKRSIIKKEATLTALGASGAVISKHFDVIIGDDLVGLENARTEKQRSNLNEWFYSSLFPTLEPDGEIHILGTRYNPLDLYEDLIKSTHYAEVYSPTKIETFKCVDDGSCGATGKGKARQFASYEFVEEKSHIFGRIPIITVYNNEEQMSDLEKIETLVNDYDKVLSDVSNEFEAFRNAYLMLKNMVAGNDSIQKLKDEGIVEVMENGDMKFITKEIQTEALENHLNRLEKNIHKFSAVPDLSDENFAGNLSGVAIRFKLFGLETKCIIKERKMEKAIKELVRVLSVPIHVNTGREVDVLNLKVEFSRNVPNNLTEIVDTVTKLDGKVDKETLLSLLPFIDNPKEVLEKLEADKERDRQNTDPYSTQNITEDSNYLFPNLNAQNSRQEALNAQGATIPQPEQ